MTGMLRAGAAHGLCRARGSPSALCWTLLLLLHIRGRAGARGARTCRHVAGQDGACKRAPGIELGCDSSPSPELAPSASRPIPELHQPQVHPITPIRVPLTLRGQVEADVPIEVHGAMEAAVTGLTQAEGAAVAQLPALCVVAFLQGCQSISCGRLAGGMAGTTRGKVPSPTPKCSWHVVHREC